MVFEIGTSGAGRPRSLGPRQSKSLLYDLSAPESPGRMADLIAYLQLIEDVPEWPIQGSAVVQVALYLLIPVVSWLGSLLIENLLGFLLG